MRMRRTNERRPVPARTRRKVEKSAGRRCTRREGTRRKQAGEAWMVEVPSGTPEIEHLYEKWLWLVDSAAITARERRRWVNVRSQRELTGSGTFLSCAVILQPKRKIDKGDLSWVEPLKPRGPNLFDIGLKSPAKPAEFDRFLGVTDLV